MFPTEIYVIIAHPKGGMLLLVWKAGIASVAISKC